MLEDSSDSVTVEFTDPAHQRALEWIRSGDKQLFIDGNWVDSRTGNTLESVNPATEQHLAQFSSADGVDVDAAVVAARRAFEAASWSGHTPHERTRALLRIAETIDRHVDELAAIESIDNGMPLWLSTAQASGAAETFRYYAGWPSKIFGTTIPKDASALMYTLREPVGVCGQIVAWNTPLAMAASKIANALACGNTVVLKPAELTPLSTLRLGELIQDTDLPPGVVNIVPGPGATAGVAIAAHPGLDKVAFVGSTAVGRLIVQASAGNLKRLTLELGGKSPNIIFPDADIEKAVQAAVRSICFNSGQHCAAGTRLLVHTSLHQDVAHEVAKLAATYKVGSPFDPDTKLGPLISSKQLDRVLSYIDAGRTEGAELQFGGSRVGSTGYFIQPTVFSGVSNEMKIAREEIFGPVLSIIPFVDEADAVLKGNDTDYGLSAAVWTQDLGRAHRVAHALKAGRVWINAYGEGDLVVPFGGYKQSGYGRENGPESIDEYTQTKAILMRY